MVERLGGVSDLRIIDDRPIGGSAKLRVVAPDRSVIAPLAALPAVQAIDEVPEPRLDDANAAGNATVGYA